MPGSDALGSLLATSGKRSHSPSDSSFAAPFVFGDAPTSLAGPTPWRVPMTNFSSEPNPNQVLAARDPLIMRADARRPGGYWDWRFWVSPRLRDVYEREATRADVFRQPVPRFRTLDGLTCDDRGQWTLRRERCSLRKAADLLGVETALLHVWSGTYAMSRRRMTAAQRAFHRRLLREPAGKFLRARAVSFSADAGWWHSDS